MISTEVTRTLLEMTELGREGLATLLNVGLNSYLRIPAFLSSALYCLLLQTSILWAVHGGEISHFWQ